MQEANSQTTRRSSLSAESAPGAASSPGAGQATSSVKLASPSRSRTGKERELEDAVPQVASQDMSTSLASSAGPSGWVPSPHYRQQQQGRSPTMSTHAAFGGHAGLSQSQGYASYGGNAVAGPSNLQSRLYHQQGTARLPRPSETFTRELSNVIQHNFLPSISPTPDEYLSKENARKLLEGLAARLYPGAKLVPFGSQANGMALRNSDMDLCFLGPEGQPPKPASELVEVLGKLIQEEAPQFQVKMLPRARIPIIKLTMLPSPGNPCGMQCDIGFENRLAIENTRLLRAYVGIDPRLRTLVLFLKVWVKRRKINNPYIGTLSSYGYTILVLHYLMHIRKPAVLPNLQRIPPISPKSTAQTEFDGCNTYFFDELALLPRFWQNENTDSIGELLIGFFYYYHKEFRYSFDVVSIRTDGGILSKASKGWMSDQALEAEYNAPRDLNRLCIEDPFQIDYNVARTVTVDGLFTIRGEIARAATILRGTRHDQIATSLIAELMEEREDYLIQAPSPSSTNRRRSAPSPRLQPSLAPTQGDFRNWAMANGVPHATGASNIPLYSHHLQAPLSGPIDGSMQAKMSTPDSNMPVGFQPAVKALSQANLQQHHQVLAGGILPNTAQSNQQLLANIPGLSPTASYRGYRPPRRFHEPNPRHYRNQGSHQQHQYNGNQYNSYSATSPQTPQSSQFLHPSAMTLSPAPRAPGQPSLERRSSWDGGQAKSDMHQQYVGSSSMSDAGAADFGIMTAPTSPNVGSTVQLPHYPRYPATPNSSASSTPSHTHSGASYDNFRGVNGRTSYQQNSRGRIYRARDESYGYHQQPSMTSALPMASGPVPAQQSQPIHLPDPSFGQPTTQSSSVDADADELRPGDIKFGNFDSAYYSSEPAEMAGLGLYDGITGLESPEPRSPVEDTSFIPEQPLPPSRMPPAPSASEQKRTYPNSVPVREGARFKPVLGDIPGSPSKRSTPGTPELSRRPSMHNRRRSAGDEAGLNLSDITFFGNVPVNRDERQRQKAMEALLKEGTRETKPRVTGADSSAQAAATVSEDNDALPTEPHPGSPPQTSTGVAGGTEVQDGRSATAKPGKASSASSTVGAARSPPLPPTSPRMPPARKRNAT